LRCSVGLLKEQEQDSRATSVAVIAALVVLVAIVAVIALSGGAYTVSARFISASQLVKGNEVKVAGQPVGTVKEIELTDDGQARVEFTVEEDAYSPLRRGTRAIVRQTSLSGVANRYIDLQLGGADRPEIPDGGVIPGEDTVSAIDLDQLFDTFDPRTRKAVGGTIRLLRDFNAGRTDDANDALRLLNPALSTSSRLFAELNRNTPDFERFITATSRLVTDVADRDDAVASLIANLATTTDALASRRDDLAAGVGLLPRFLRKGNTTFVSLRSALDQLDPLVDDAKPIVRDKLIPLFDSLRPFARDAAPTLRDVSRAISRRGADNDLIEVLRRQPAIDRIANRTAQRNGAQRPGAFPASRAALAGATPQFEFLRPYSVDLVGWFDDFSSSGAYDALGSFSRAGLELNQFTITPLLGAQPVPPELRDALLAATTRLQRNNRCPGSVERAAPDGSNPYLPSQDFNCDKTMVPIGP
jgi:phospholipid/cholesterol/gamma-HCH transport system substrate-binding protein